MQIGVYLWYEQSSKLFKKMRRDVNFGNNIVKFVRKGKKEERESDLGNGNAEISTQLYQLT